MMGPPDISDPQTCPPGSHGQPVTAQVSHPVAGAPGMSPPEPLVPLGVPAGLPALGQPLALHRPSPRNPRGAADLQAAQLFTAC